ncbi:MAG: hypothetical protein QOD07_2413 [Frankiaceae bacterium]|nr:hypothetical protein [Frankiaceae bacterium]
MSLLPHGVTDVMLASGGAPIDLNHPGHYVHWGVIQISVANLIVIAVMIVLFALAIFLPFPKGRGRR